MICKICGEATGNTGGLCAACAAEMGAPSMETPPPEPEKRKVRQFTVGSLVSVILSFLFPFLGFLLYQHWKNHKPIAAKAALIAAWICVILYVASIVAAIALGFVLGDGTGRVQLN